MKTQHNRTKHKGNVYLAGYPIEILLNLFFIEISRRNSPEIAIWLKILG